MPIADSLLQLVGKTPMVRLSRIAAGMAEVVVKLEAQNPAGSVKDRVCVAMVEAAELAGKLRPGDTIVEPTSGNTGIGLALVAAVKGYRLILCMPDDASVERRALLAHYGAEVVLTPARKLMRGAVERAKEIVANNPRCFMPQQFDNPANPAIHRETTAREILEATDGALDAFVAGVGTGGTITGVGEVLKEKKPGVRMIAVEPQSAAVLSGGRAGPHFIQGIGAGFVPKILQRDLIDEVFPITEDASFEHARRLASEEGILVGISADAAMAAAMIVAKREEMRSKMVVVILPDGGERYVSTPLFKELLDKDLDGRKRR